MSNSGSLLSSVPIHDRPRERLARLGAVALTDAEVLALVMGSGVAGRNVVAAAGVVLETAGGFRALMSMDAAALKRIPGVGPATAGRLAAAAEMWRRAAEPTAKPRLVDSAAVARVAFPELVNRDRERVVLLVADRSLRLIEVVVFREGSDHDVELDVGEALQSVLIRRGRAFAVAHNHLGGSLEPSVADVSATTRLRGAAATVGVRFLDHLIVAGADWRSIG